VIAARTNADATAMRDIRLMTGFILIPPRKITAQAPNLFVTLL